MWEYKGTSRFDIGAGYGEYTYDFFVVDDEDDFWNLSDFYANLWNRFDYYVDHGSRTEDNKEPDNETALKALKTLNERAGQPET
jgi:hypothetical protein